MRRMLVFCMIVLMSLPAIPGTAFGEQERSIAPKRSQKELQRQASLREKAEFFGPGAQIRITLRGGSSAADQGEGEIDEISESSFKLKTKESGLLMYEYRQLESLHLKQVSYKSIGQPDPVQVRRVAYELGIGNKVNLDLIDLKRFSGIIQSFEKESFVVASNKNPVSVQYGEVKAIDKMKFPAWGKVAIVAGVVAGLLIALMYAACGSGGCH
jgi:hypothetical protein